MICGYLYILVTHVIAPDIQAIVVNTECYTNRRDTQNAVCKVHVLLSLSDDGKYFMKVLPPEDKDENNAPLARGKVNSNEHEMLCMSGL